MPTIVDLTQFSMEEHVERSFRTAWALAAGEPINAYHAIGAAIIVSRSAQSPAFSKLASLLPSSETGQAINQTDLETDLTDLSLDSSLAAAYSTAEPFFRQVSVVWGRDYITFALLALDPSLERVLGQTDLGLEDLRDEWFRFVTSDKDHRKPESWADWWYSAGVPLPSERNQSPTGKAYLLTWDPERTAFTALADGAKRVEQEGAAVHTWSVGGKGASIGDRVFLMRHGEDRPGLVGSGQIVSHPWEGRHWDRSKPASYTATYANVLWDTLGEFPLVPLEELTERTNVTVLWTQHGTGFRIDDNVAEQLESIWAEARKRLQQIPPRAWVETDVVIRTQEYQPSEHDSLDMKQQAEIFATLLIAKDVQPPFALGLLGDWGVGKTFFMHLMYEKVSSIGGKGAYADQISDSVSRVAQIEFNAWHYVDSDLWASLASHIFDELAEELLGQTEEKVEEIRQRLRSTIRSSTRERENAEAAIDTAKQARQSAAKILAEKQRERARKAAQCDTLRLKRVWEAVLKVKPNQENPDWPDLAALKKEAEGTAKRLGITDVINNVEEAQRVYTSLREIYGKGSSLTMAFASTFTGTRTWLSIAAVLLLLMTVLSWPLILGKVEAFFGYSEESVTQLLGPVLQLGTIVGAAATWAGRNLKSISSAMSYLEAILGEIRKPRLELAQPDGEETELQEFIENLDAEIVTEQRQIKEADRQIAEAQAEIQRINAGGLVYDFLEGRVRDSRYLDRLGLISVIRQDFEQLSSLLRDWRKNRPDSDGEETSSPDDEAGSDGEVTSQSAVLWDPRPIERIILYIDDLDRCPPQRVVEVLQAIHLLLAFDLFVVVVAVDARWLERSLNETYNPRRAQEGTPSEALHQFSAHNYLEKIFQIPFSLPAMDEKGYRQLISDMIAAPKTQAEIRHKQREQDEEEHVQPEREEAGLGQREREEVELGQREREEEGKRKQREQDKERRQREREEAEERIKTMMLHEGEEQFIAALFHFIDTPRLAKRFVNIYRLLRVRASMLGRDFATFINREHGDYRAVLILLAIGIGYSNVAPEILRNLRTPKASNFRTWLDEMSKQYEKEREQEEKKRISQNQESRPSSREIRLAELRDALNRIHRDIDTVVQALKEYEGPPFDDSLETYARWAREVGRYSFR